MKLDSANDLLFVLAVLVPGFVFSAVLSQLVPRRLAGTTETLILGYLTGTAFNYAVCGFPLYLVLRGYWLAGAQGWQLLVWFITIFLAPVLLAVLVGAGLQNNWPTYIFRTIGLRWINLIPTGWDWKFSRTAPCYAIVTLQNGTKIAGYFGESSMASSDPEHRDLFLEKVYTVPETGPWDAVPESDGIFIDGSQIAYVEFLTGR